MSLIQPARVPAPRSRARRLLGTSVAGAVIAATVLTCPAHAAGGGDIYVSNLRGNNVSVVDPATDTVVATIPVGSFPFGDAVSPDGTQVWVTNNGSNSVSVIDAATNTVTGTIPVGLMPEAVAFSPDGTRAYVAHFVSPGVGGVQVFDVATRTALADIHVDNQPTSIAVSPDGSRVYSSNFIGSSVSVIDASTNTVVATISNPAARTPNDVAVSPDGSRAYTANFNSSNVSVIDTATDTILALVPAGSGTAGVAVTPDGTRVFTSNENSNNVSVIDTTTDTVVATIPVGSTPTAIAISGTRAYVTNGLANSMSVIDTTTDTVVGTVPVGSVPIALATQPTPAVQAPTVTAVNPTSGRLSGGNTVIITGTHLTGATAVDFGGTPAASFTVDGDTQITATAPAGSAGTVDVTVTTPAGTSATSSADQYTYLYSFTGFLPPVGNPPTLNLARAGRTVPIKFSLSGDMGLDVLAPGSPTATPVNCVTGAALGPAVPTDTPGSTSLQYDRTTMTYQYNWKTSKAYAPGSCEQFSLTLNDGTVHTARFEFGR